MSRTFPIDAGSLGAGVTSNEPWWEIAHAALRDLLALAKPGIVGHCVLMAALGGWLGSAPLVLPRFLSLLFGVGLVVGGANALNMYIEREIDRLMHRTQHRPLPSGRVPPSIALYAGISWACLGLLTLYTVANPLTAILAATAFASYVLIYTPLKRKSWAALLVGTVPGAMPPLLGSTGMEGMITGPGLALFVVVALWQIPHFIAIAVHYAEDYRRGGMRILPLERGNALSFRIANITSVALLPATLLFPLFGVGGMFYVCFAVVLGLAFAGLGFRTMNERASMKQVRRFFFATLLYLPVLCAGLFLTTIP